MYINIKVENCSNCVIFKGNFSRSIRDIPKPFALSYSKDDINFRQTYTYS